MRILTEMALARLRASSLESGLSAVARQVGARWPDGKVLASHRDRVVVEDGENVVVARLHQSSRGPVLGEELERYGREPPRSLGEQAAEVVSLFFGGHGAEASKRLLAFARTTHGRPWVAPAPTVGDLVDRATHPGTWWADFDARREDVRALVGEERRTQVERRLSPSFRAIRAGMYDPAVQESFRTTVAGSFAGLVGVVADDLSRLRAARDLLAGAEDEVGRDLSIFVNSLEEWVGGTYERLGTLSDLGELASVEHLATAHDVLAERWADVGVAVAFVDLAIDRMGRRSAEG